MAQYERQYETTIVIDSFLKGDEIKDFVTKLQNFIKNNGGRVDSLEEWGKKRLAYEINRKQYANYIYILFTGPSTLPELLEREYRLEESVIRYLTVIADPRALAERSAAKAPPKPVTAAETKSADAPVTTEVTPPETTPEAVETSDAPEGEVEKEEATVS